MFVARGRLSLSANAILFCVVSHVHAHLSQVLSFETNLSQVLNISTHTAATLIIWLHKIHVHELLT